MLQRMLSIKLATIIIGVIALTLTSRVLAEVIIITPATWNSQTLSDNETYRIIRGGGEPILTVAVGQTITFGNNTRLIFEGTGLIAEGNALNRIAFTQAVGTSGGRIEVQEANNIFIPPSLSYCDFNGLGQDEVVGALTFRQTQPYNDGSFSMEQVTFNNTRGSALVLDVRSAPSNVRIEYESFVLSNCHFSGIGPNQGIIGANGIYFLGQQTVLDANAGFQINMLSLNGVSFQYFGYNAPTAFSASQLGAAIKAVGNGFVLLSWNDELNVNTPAVKMCGHGIYVGSATAGGVRLTGCSLIAAPTNGDSIRFVNLRGSGIWVDGSVFNMTTAQLRIHVTGLDAIHVGHSVYNDANHDYDIHMQEMVISDVGLNRYSTMETEANGFSLTRGEFREVHFVNSWIDRTYSNGIKLYDESAQGDETAALHTTFIFERDIPGDQQGDPVDHTRQAPTFIENGGYSFGGLFVPLIDQTHGVRIGLKHFGVAPDGINLGSVSLFDVGISRCSGNGIAIRGNGYCSNPVQIRVPGAANFTGSVFVTGCKISQNLGNGIDVDGSGHYLVVQTQSITEGRQLRGWIAANVGAGILLEPDYHTPSTQTDFKQNKFLIGGKSDSEGSAALIVEKNGRGGFVAKEGVSNENDTHYRIYDNAFYAGGEIYIEGCRFVQGAGEEYGVCLASNQADNNLLEISSSISDRQEPPGKQGGQVVINLWGTPQVFNHTLDGVFVQGFENEIVIKESEIYTNLHNGVLIEQRPTTAAPREMAGSHSVTVEGCFIRDNLWNGVQVVSRENETDPNALFGSTNLTMNYCYVLRNTSAANQNSLANIWIHQYSGESEVNNCDVSEAVTGHGMLVSGWSNGVTLGGGRFALNEQNGFTIAAQATATNIVTSIGSRSFTGGNLPFPVGDPPGENHGPLFQLNEGSGFYIYSASDPNADLPILRLNYAICAQNEETGFSTDRCLMQGPTYDTQSNFRGSRFLLNGEVNFYDGASCSNTPVTYTEVYGGPIGFLFARPPSLFAHNVIHNVTDYAVRIAGGNGTGQSSIINNTIINEGDFGGGGFEIPIATAITMYANVCQISTLSLLKYAYDVPGSVVLEYNLAWCPGGREWASLAPHHTNGGPPPVGTNLVADPKIILLSGEQYQSYLVPYRYHVDYRSPTINVVPLTITECRDVNGTLGDLGAFGGSGYDPLHPEPRDQVLPTLRAGNVSLLIQTPLDSLVVSGTLKSGSYQFMGSILSIAENTVFTLEDGVRIDMGYYESATFPTEPPILRVNGRLETVSNPFPNAPYTGLDGYKVFSGGRWKRKNLQDGAWCWEFKKDVWNGIEFSPTAIGSVNEETVPMRRLQCENLRNGIRIIGPDGNLESSEDYRDTLLFHHLVIRPDENEVSAQPKALSIQDRPVMFDTLVINRYGTDSNPPVGIDVYESTNHNEPPFQDTYVRIDRLSMVDVNGAKPYQNAIRVEGLGGCCDGQMEVPYPFYDPTSFVLTNSKIDGASNVVYSEVSTGIKLSGANYFKFDRDTVVNIIGGNALYLTTVPNFGQVSNVIFRSRFAKAKHSESHAGNDGTGIVFYDDAFPTLVECDVDSNDRWGIHLQNTASPYFINYLRSRGSRIFNNGLYSGDGVDGAQVYFDPATGTGAPLVNLNSIFDQSTNRALIRAPRVFANGIPDQTDCFHQVWWGRSSPDITRMWSYTSMQPPVFNDHPRFWWDDPNNPNDFDYLPYPPNDDYWGYPTSYDGIRALNEGDYPLASQLFFDCVTNDTVPIWHRSHSVPLMFVANERNGWTYEQDLALLDSLQAAYENTEMYLPVRNYKPLLDLLHQDPEAAYQTYDQFRIAPLSFEDSILAVIGMAILKPVDGPENKRGGDMSDSWRIRENRIRELQALLDEHRRKTNSTQERLVPESYKLGNPYPNPFNSSIHFQVDLPLHGRMMYTIYDALGREVYRKAIADLAAGSYIMHWNGLDNSGLPASSGVYFVQVRAETFSAVKKIVLIK